ncbi:MAG: hypothetical protein MUC99_07005 [Anaerolineae bacterium]|jgi:hypothetical protein|nr:hypothetical protein [Anaerolineae bacterium]
MTRNSLTRRPDPDAPRPSFNAWVMQRSRFVRTVYVFIGAMALALLLMPVVDQLMFRFGGVSIGPNTTSSWFVLALCMGMYFSGYALVIGIPGEKPPTSRAQNLYITLVPITLLLAVVWYGVQWLSLMFGG